MSNRYKFIIISILVILIISFSSAVFAIQTPKWIILWIVLPRLDVDHQGSHYKFTLSEDEIAKIYEMGARTERFIEEASQNAVDVEIIYMTSNQAVTTLTENEYIYVDENDLPLDVQAKIDQINPHLKMVTYRLEDSENPKINDHWGLGGGLYARVRFLGISTLEISETRPYPEEVYVHELLHCFDWFYCTLLHYEMPGCHNPDIYGYEKVNNSYAAYYQDTFAGKVKNATGQYIGITQKMWSRNPSNTDIPRQGQANETGCNAGLNSITLLLILFFPIKPSKLWRYK